MTFQPWTLTTLPDNYAVCRLDADAALPPWATASSFFSITRTPDELSIVCLHSSVPQGIRCERDWRCLHLAGQIPFTRVGVLASLVQPLAEEGISVFAISTFDTDYLLVKAADLPRTIDALRQREHVVSRNPAARFFQKPSPRLFSAVQLDTGKPELFVLKHKPTWGLDRLRWNNRPGRF